MNAEAITRRLGGRWYRTYGLAFCPAHDNRRTPALSLKDGHGGRLLAFCQAGCSFRDVLAGLRARGLVEGFAQPPVADPVHIARQAAAARAERAKAVARARRCWAETEPIGGTLAERYLRRRAIRCALPQKLRFHPACRHGATAQRLPALVAAVVREAALVGVHRTWLVEPGAKAGVEPQRAMLGPVGGGAVRLSEEPGPLVVTEGIETGLSLVDLLRDHRPRVWAALSTSGVGSLLLPPTPGELVIAPDGDDAGQKAATRLACRARHKGWHVRLMAPPAPGRDWNDVVREVPA